MTIVLLQENYSCYSLHYLNDINWIEASEMCKQNNSTLWIVDSHEEYMAVYHALVHLYHLPTNHVNIQQWTDFVFIGEAQKVYYNYQSVELYIYGNV